MPFNSVWHNITLVVSGYGPNNVLLTTLDIVHKLLINVGATGFTTAGAKYARELCGEIVDENGPLPKLERDEKQEEDHPCFSCLDQERA